MPHITLKSLAGALAALAAILSLAVAAPPPASAQTPAFATAYQNDWIASEARRIQAEIVAETPRVDRPSRDLLRDARALVASGDPRGALERLAQAIVINPRSHTLWNEFARASLAVEPFDWSERYRLQERAVAGGFNAFRNAETPTEAARGLATLAAAFAAREEWRDALAAYRASLALEAAPVVQAEYEELRALYGFRILSYEIDSDSASPRACFVFSETLPPRVDLSPYVAVSGASGFAVTSSENELCVDGLAHGATYGVVLRAGIPSTVGESLERSADYEIYVRDRAPQARFTGRNYVLPRLGQEGVPVVSTNADAVEIAIYRIGDRSLLPTVRSEEFLGQLSRWSADEIAAERGAPVWSGSLAVEQRRNEDVVTAFPVSEAVGPLDPGVYVMTARAASLQPDDEDYGPRATQWFVVSDLGLTAFAAADGVHVLVRSLASAEPLPGVSVRLVARNNEVLATRETDADGHVRFDPGLSRGSEGLAPGLVTAELSGDYGFLDLGQPAFDLTDRGVAGRPIAGALEAFVFPERGVYRSGETVHLTALLRDAAGRAAPGAPLTLVVRRPDGVEHLRRLMPDEGFGGRVLPLALLSDAMPGTWRVTAHVDPRGPAVGEAAFLVEDYLPERIEVALRPSAPAIPAGDPAAEIDLSARFLFGAPAADLVVGAEIVVGAAERSGVPGLSGWTVGLSDETVDGGYDQVSAVARTEADGSARVRVDVPLENPDAASTRPLEATIALDVAEEGGRAVVRRVTLPILPEGPVLAARSVSGGLAEGSVAAFEAIAARPDGTRLSGEATWSLLRVEQRYQWFQTGGRWGFEPVTVTERVASGTARLSPDAPARFEAPVGWGRHRLEVASLDGSLAPVSLTFDVGWSGDATARAPDLLDVTLDKASYSDGETLVATIGARAAGKATLAVVSDRVHALRTIDVGPGGASARIPVSADWGASAYLVAIAHRPLDAAARRQPGRALGLAHLSIDRAARDLGVALDAPAEMRPRGELRVPVRLANLEPGAEARVVVAAVDVGILNLTGYEPPDATEHFLGQKQLGVEIRDLYGFLIDGMQGVRGAIRSGGDGGAPNFAAPPPREAPLALHSGIVRVGPDGTAEVVFDIPAFNGTVRVIAVAWSQDRIGEASVDVIVRDPVVLTATRPRFLNVGDETRLHLRLDNVSGVAGEYRVEALPRGPLDIPVGARVATLRLAAGASAAAEIPIAALAPGMAGADVIVTGPDLDVTQTVAFEIQPGTAGIVRREVRPLAPGASLRLTDDLVSDLVPGTAQLAVSVAPIGRLDPAGMTHALGRWPYGCTEQLVSQALPLLYAESIGGADGLDLPAPREEIIRATIARILARQTQTGAFGLWEAGWSDDVWLAAYATDFLTRARELGFEVPQAAMDRALARLRNHVVNTTEVDGAVDLPYAVYVLARNGRPVMGDLRYLADARLDAFETPLARAQIAAGLALLGDARRADAAFASAAALLGDPATRARGYRADYGSRLRDAAGMLALVGEAGTGRGAFKRIAAAIDEESAANPSLSTQEMAWLAIAARSVAEEAAAIRLDVGGTAVAGPYGAVIEAERLADGGLVLRNDGERGVEVALTVTGNPVARDPAISNGLSIERVFYRLDGSVADPATVRQNERLVATLTVEVLDAVPGRLLVVDRLPAGFEIDNPALVDANTVSALPWLVREAEPDRVEYRDDRFVAAFDSQGFVQPTLTLAYAVRVVSPGAYLHPPASVEDMYRPERFARTDFGTVTARPAR